MDALCDSPPIAAAARQRGRSEWLVAGLRCFELGQQLHGAPPASQPPRLSEDPETAVLAEILAAAVCHSTNWDRLRDTVRRAAGDRELFTASRLAQLDLATFAEAFGEGFASSEPLSTRYRLLTETAACLARRSPFDPRMIAERPVTLGGSDGFYEQLRAMPAFARDPEGKKARILVQELCRTRLILATDPQHVRPAVEYHLIRLYLRTQRVIPARVGDELRLHTSTTFQAPIIMRIRRAVEEAMYLTASAAEMSIVELNQIEWQIARSFCERHGPRCDGPPQPSKPCDRRVMALATDLRCPFFDVCGTAHDARFTQLVEPQLSPRYDFY